MKQVSASSRSRSLVSVKDLKLGRSEKSFKGFETFCIDIHVKDMEERAFFYAANFEERADAWKREHSLHIEASHAPIMTC